MGLEHERPSIGVDEGVLFAALRLFADIIAAWASGPGGLDTAAVERSLRRGSLIAHPPAIED
jgi:hypothetical protein